jgi:hypothetical protein
MKYQYPTQTVAAEGTNGTWTSTDGLGLVTITVTTLLHKQSYKSLKSYTFAVQPQETLLSMVVLYINSVSIYHLPVDNSGSILAAQYCHMVPSHKMHLNRLLTALKHSMKDVNLHHVMATPLSTSRQFCFFHFHLYSSGRQFNSFLNTLLRT